MKNSHEKSGGSRQKKSMKKRKIKYGKPLSIIIAVLGLTGMVLVCLESRSIAVDGKREIAFSSEEEQSLETGFMENLSFENESESESESDSEKETENIKEPESETGTGEEIEPESGTVAGDEIESEIETGTGNECEAETGGTEENAESENVWEDQSGQWDEYGTENNPETEPEAESENPQEPETEQIDEPASTAEPETEQIMETENPVESESETEPATESENIVESESETESAGESEITVESESETESAAESENTGELETETEPATEPVTAPETEKEMPRLPEKIQRGIHYDIVGDGNAWYRDGKDRLWIRAGTNLYIETKAGSGYDRGLGKENLQTDGILTFSLKKTDAQGCILAESEIRQEAYYVDEAAPAATITVSGVEKEGIIYAVQTAEAAITVAPDGKSGLKQAAYSVVPCEGDGTFLVQPEDADWIVCDSSQQLDIRREGTYCIYVRTEDCVGNIAFSKSSLVCVDSTPPSISVEGVKDQTANSGKVRIRVQCQDEYYRAGSMEIAVTGVNNGRNPVVYEKKEDVQGAVAEFLDFPRQQGYDDVYHLTVRAGDIAGNVTKKEISFSVNRFGSVYDLAEETKENLKLYYLKSPEEVVFYETNIDYVGESEIFCRRDGELEKLKRGNDYQVTMEGSRESWKQYQYRIPSEYFDQEGVYELLLSSRDQADNESDTGIQEKKVSFVLDWTAPDCTITGLVGQKTYDADYVTACMAVSDNTGIKSLKVYRNSELFMEKREREVGKDPLKITVDASDDWQTFQVFACDMAGNEYWSEEIPVYINKNVTDIPVYKKVRVSAEELEMSGKMRKEADKKQADDESGAVLAENVQARKNMLYEAEGKTGENKGKSLWNAERKMEGILLLGFGIAVFLTTSAACLLGCSPILRGKKR